MEFLLLICDSLAEETNKSFVIINLKVAVGFIALRLCHTFDLSSSQLDFVNKVQLDIAAYLTMSWQCPCMPYAPEWSLCLGFSVEVQSSTALVLV